LIPSAADTSETEYHDPEQRFSAVGRRAAVTPLGSQQAKPGVPDTYPFAL
jgi:hypothetical protein